MNRWVAAALSAVVLVVLAGSMVARAAGPTVTDHFNRDFTTQQRNHFGDPAKGFVIAEEWVIDDYISSNGNVVACSRWFVTSKAKRVAISTINVRDAKSNVILQTTTVGANSNGAPLVQLCAEPVDPPGDYYIEVVASIRWADDTLSSGVSFGSTIDAGG